MESKENVQLLCFALFQLIYIVVSATVNNLLLRREMCHWFKGMQIRYNLSELEEWLRNHRLAECGTLEQLAVLVEIAQLLQVGKKTDADADNVANMCSKLTPQQVRGHLNKPIMRTKPRTLPFYMQDVVFGRFQRKISSDAFILKL